MRAFECNFDGVKVIHSAKSAGQARMMAAKIIFDCGYVRTIGEAIKKIKVKRRQDLDDKQWWGQLESYYATNEQTKDVSE